MIQSLDAPDFDLRHTLESGQTFRWRRAGEGYLGVVGGGLVEIAQDGPRLRYRASDPATLNDAWLTRYFALDLNLPAILRDIDRDVHIHEAVRRYRGLRLIRQEPWECLASYICSSFNNIRRIEGMIERLAQRFGAPVSLDGRIGHTFPSAQAIAEAPLETLTALGLGFRAAYLRQTAQRIVAGGVDVASLRLLPYEEAKATLLSLPGVGDKVADCILLFSQGQMQAFPIDVWMERALRFYFRRRLPPRRRLHAFARRHFGAYAGYAQQYLFHYLRCKTRRDDAPALPVTPRAAVPQPRPAVAAAFAHDSDAIS